MSEARGARAIVYSVPDTDFVRITKEKRLLSNYLACADREAESWRDARWDS